MRAPLQRANEPAKSKTPFEITVRAFNIQQQPFDMGVLMKRRKASQRTEAEKQKVTEQQCSGNASGVNLRSEAQREFDLSRMSSWVLQGKPQWWIGKQLGISQAQVSDDYAELKKRWRDDALMNITEMKAQQLAGLREHLRLSYEAYAKSCLPKKQHRRKTKQLTIEGAEGETALPARETERSIMVEHQAPGNPALLAQALAAYNAVAELMGLPAPKKTSLTDPSGERPMQLLSDDALELIAMGAVAKGGKK